MRLISGRCCLVLFTRIVGDCAVITFTIFQFEIDSFDVSSTFIFQVEFGSNVNDNTTEQLLGPAGEDMH